MYVLQLSLFQRYAGVNTPEELLKFNQELANIAEDKAGDLHSFTILDKPYDNIDKVVKDGESPDISFAATKTGVFTYECKFHLPTMHGQLVVEAPSLDELRGSSNTS